MAFKISNDLFCVDHHFLLKLFYHEFKNNTHNRRRIEELEYLIKKTVRREVKAAILEVIPRQPDGPMDMNGCSAYLGLAKASIYEKTSRDEIPHYKVGKKLYFRRKELDKWLNRHRRKPAYEYEPEIAEYLKKHPYEDLFKRKGR